MRSLGDAVLMFTFPAGALLVGEMDGEPVVGGAALALFAFACGLSELGLQPATKNSANKISAME